MHTHPQFNDIERVNKKKNEKNQKTNSHTYTRESVKNQSL